jgi:type I restriction enzyme S subunit
MRASYPTYKSTSIPWMPEMPEHWEQRKNKYLFRRSKSLVGKDFEKYPVLSLTMNGVIRRDLDNPMGKMPATFADYQLIQDNTLLFCLFDYDVTPRTVGMVNEKGIVSPAYTSMYPVEKINLQYYYYWFLMLDERKMLLTHVTNLRNSISYETFAGLFSPFPPLTEQTAIANYLDAKSEQINRFIEKKQKLIALLKEQKQAVINELLSNSSNNWPLVKLKFLLTEVNERSETGMEELLSLSKYQGVIPKSKLEERAGGAESLVGYKKVYYDNIVVNKMQASNGIIGVSKVEGITSPDYSIYKVKSNEFTPDFIGYMLVQPHMLAEYRRVSTGVMDGYIRLYTDDLFDIKIAIPKKSEQLDVLRKIDQATTQINLTINQVESEVDKVKELKQSLIAEVVTGRIKVV